MSKEKLGEEIFVSRGKQIEYDGYLLFDIDEDIVPSELMPLKGLIDYIEGSRQYLGLGGKTQVLNDGVENPELGVTTRLIHDMQVSQNSMKISRALGGNLRDILIAQIGGLGHDLGHTPFGHDGEVALASAIGEELEGVGFSHSEYGSAIIGALLDNYIESNKDSIAQMGIDSELFVSTVEEAREEIMQAVRNHSHYFQYDMVEETRGEKSVRLADTLSFMVSDLSDLMRGEDARNPGQKILTKERMIEEIKNIPNLDDSQLKQMLDMVDLLYEGGDALREIHEKLIKETFETDRALLRENEEATIIDDIKFLYDIESKAMGIEKNDTALGRIETFKTIGEYYKYISKLKSEDTSEIRRNNAFKRRISNILNIDEEEALKKVEEILDKLNSSDNIKDNTAISLKLSTEELKVIKAITNDLVDREKPGSLRDIARNTSNLIVDREMEVAPTLLTLYTIQNKIQYGEILASPEAKEILGNGTIITESGEEKDVTEMIKERFAIIYNMAKKVQENPEAYTLEDGSLPDLKTYKDVKVPPFYYNQDGERKEDPALSYAVYAVQQMQNKDFVNEDIMADIGMKLGFSKEEFLRASDEVAIVKAKREFEKQKLEVNILGKIGKNTSIDDLITITDYLDTSPINTFDKPLNMVVGENELDEELLRDIEDESRKINKYYSVDDVEKSTRGKSHLGKRAFEKVAKAISGLFKRKNNIKDNDIEIYDDEINFDKDYDDDIFNK